MTSGDLQEPRSPRARQLLDYLQNAAESPYARVDSVGFEEVTGRDFIDITVEPELVQHRAVAIRNTEPLRLLFWPDDENPPSVLSRRDDFPLDLVHTNFASGSNGRSLCIWEENWSDIRRVLTAEALVERIRDWFSRTASGSLHDAGQPLEPMIPATSDTLIIPVGPPPDIWHVADVKKRGRQYVVVLDRKPIGSSSAVLEFPIFTVSLPPQVHGALHSRPYSLRALQRLVQATGVDFNQQFKNWLIEPVQLKSNERTPLIIVMLPKQREPGGPVEAWEVWAFLTVSNLGQLGEAYGLTYAGENKTSNHRIPAISPEQPPDSGLLGWRVVQRLNREAARHFSGNHSSSDYALVALGAGAIGSNVIVGTTRAGIGTWTIIDNDITLPHNTVRQAQTDFSIGKSKALTAAMLADCVLAESGSSHIDTNFLEPEEAKEQVEQALATADLVVDFSASPSVLGKIADDNTVRRTASLFFNPTGSDLVLLAEDNKRIFRLDELEAQYFLAVAQDAELAGHLASARMDFIRYANACQDLSRPLPPWQVQALCGIASGQVLKLLGSPDTAVLIWRLDTDSASVRTVALPRSKTHRLVFSGWRMTFSAAVLHRMRALRRDALPNETGGVLIGSYDILRGVLHIVAALPAPPDSEQAPTYFTRGSQALKAAVDGISRRSFGNLRYVGEWHSHPDTAAARPSRYDEKVFDHLSGHLDPTGAPYVMAICGKDESWLRAGWHAREQSEAVIGHERD